MPDADLVLEGGGVKGISLVGAISVLEEHGYVFHRVAGTSAGAIVASLVSAGMNATQLQQVMRTIDYNRFQDPNALDHLGKVGEVLSVLFHKGIYRGDYLKDWLTEQLAGCGPNGVRTFKDLAAIDPGGDLTPETAYKLVVMTSNVSDNCLTRLPWEYDRLGVQRDDQLVADAVRMSMSIPFFYEPVEFQGRWFVDGGMLSNFPIDTFDRTDDKAPRWPTLGVKLSAKPDANLRRTTDISGPLGLAKAMIATMTNFHDQMHLDDPSVMDRTIFVDCGQVRATDFNLTDADKKMLYANGRAAAEKFISTWDFDAYKAKYRKVDPSPTPPAAVPSGTTT